MSRYRDTRSHWTVWSAILAVGLIAAMSTATWAQAPTVRHPVEAEKPAGFDERKQAIDVALASATMPRWAGHYSDFDIEMSFAPGAGAVATSYGCLGLYGANHGDIAVSDDGVVRVSYVGPNDTNETERFPQELVPVAWGERQYLIPPERIPAFASAINRGDEPTTWGSSMFLLRDGDKRKAVRGLPSLPPGTQAQVRRKPVKVKIAAVELRTRKQLQKSCANTYVLELVASKLPDPPLFVGEELEALRYGGHMAMIIAQNGASAQAEMVVYEDCDKGKGPKVGKRLTTGAYRKQ